MHTGIGFGRQLGLASAPMGIPVRQMSKNVPSNKPDQERLLGLFETDCDGAWEQFVNQFSQPIKNTIWWKLGPETDADRVEDIFVKILHKLNDDGCRRIKEFRGRCKLSTWVTGIVINQIRDEMKVRPRAPVPAISDPSHTEDGQDGRTPTSMLPSPLEQLIQKEDVERLRGCMEQLPPDEKLRLLRRFADRRKLREIGSLEGVSEGAIDGRIRKSLKKLRECMEKRKK